MVRARLWRCQEKTRVEALDSRRRVFPDLSPRRNQSPKTDERKSMEGMNVSMTRHWRPKLGTWAAIFRPRLLPRIGQSQAHVSEIRRAVSFSIALDRRRSAAGTTAVDPLDPRDPNASPG